jgi:hypothetical protein
MRAVLVLLFLSILLAPGAALGHNPCRSHCRRQGHMCKDRCKARGYDWRARRECFRGCRVREAQCKLRCRH